MARIRKDGKTYDSGDVTIAMLGAIADEISDISYSMKQEHQLNYFLGSNKGKTWSRGKEEFEASFTGSLSMMAQIEMLAPNGRLVDIKPFDINISYVNDFNVIVNDTITVKFMNQGREVTGDMGLKYKYDLFVLDMDFNNIRN